MAEPGSDALAELETFLADANDVATGKLGGSGRDCPEIPTHCSGKKTRIGIEVLLNSDIEDDRRRWKANEAGKLRREDFSA
jgi:hypothetical protein